MYVHRRGVQRALRMPGQLERFLPPEDASAIRQLMPEQWHLGRDAERAEAERLLRGDRDGFVAKNVLRPRTGSGATQDRHASGGQIVSEPTQLLELLEDDERRGLYLLYRKERPLTHDARIVHGGGVHELSGCAMSEVRHASVLRVRPCL